MRDTLAARRAVACPKVRPDRRRGLPAGRHEIDRFFAELTPAERRTLRAIVENADLLDVHGHRLLLVEIDDATLDLLAEFEADLAEYEFDLGDEEDDDPGDAEAG